MDMDINWSAISGHWFLSVSVSASASASGASEGSSFPSTVDLSLFTSHPRRIISSTSRRSVVGDVGTVGPLSSVALAKEDVGVKYYRRCKRVDCST